MIDAVKLVLERMRVPGQHNLFVLGCYERPATLYMQQVRALNLIYALSKQALPQPPSLAVIGGGGAGVTAASAAALLGWPVRIFDRLGDELLAFAGADTGTRWLHPHIYEWPDLGKDEPDAGLCILNWQSGPANRVISGLRAQWDRIRDDRRIGVALGVSDVSIEPLNKQWLVQWNGAAAGALPAGRGLQPAREAQLEEFDVVVLAVGFGEELPKPEFPMVTSYWKADDIDVLKAGTQQSPLVLVSGTGDGGIIDVLRYSFHGFRHDQVLHQLRYDWFDPADFDAARDQLRQVEDAAVEKRRKGEAYQGELNLRYRKIAKGLKPRQPIPLRSDVTAVLTGTDPWPLSLQAAALNRFLLCLTSTQYIQGPLKKVERRSMTGPWDVYFDKESAYYADNEPRSYAEVVIRHGPVAAISRWFPKIHQQCDALRKLAETGPDPTRHPIFDDDFCRTLTEAYGKLLAPAPAIAQEEVAQAAAAAKPDTDALAAFATYRGALVARIAELQDRAGLAPEINRFSVVLLSERPADPADHLRDRAADMRSSVGANETADLAWLMASPAVRFLTGSPEVDTAAVLRSLASQVLDDGQLFPVLLSLDSLEPGDDLFPLDDAVDLGAGIDALGSAERSALHRLYRDRLGQGRVIILINGFGIVDRAPEARLVRMLAQPGFDARGNRIVVLAPASSAGLIASGLSLYEILPLPETAAAAQVSEVVGRSADRSQGLDVGALLSAAGSFAPTLGALIRMLPPMAGALNVLSSALPRDPLELLSGAVIGFCLQPLDDRLDVRAGFADIAWRDHPGPATFSRDDLAATLRDRLGHDAARIDTAVDAALATAIVAPADASTYRFAHRLIEQHLAAEHLAAAAGLVQDAVALSDRADQSDLVAAMAIALSPEPAAALSRLAELPDGLDRPVLRLRARAISLARGDLGAQIDRLAQEIADGLADAAQPDETILRLAPALAASQPKLAAALAERIGRTVVASDLGIAVRTIRFVATARLTGAVRLLFPALSDPREPVRDAAADALGELRDRQAIVLLVRAYLDDRHDLVFRSAVVAVARIGGEQARAALVGILDDRLRYQNLRWPAAEALGILRDRAAVPRLVAALDDDFAIVRQHAAKALGEIGAREALPGLRARLKADSDAGVIIAAAEALGQIPDPESTPLLAGLLDGMHPAVREAAARALAKLDPRTLLDILRGTVADQTVPWRGQALRQMAEAFGEQALRTLLLLSGDRDPELRVGAADGLRFVSGAASAERLLEMLADENAEVREAAVIALDHHPYGKALGALVALAERDPSETVRMAAVKALAKLNDKDAVLPLIRLVEAGGLVGAYAANTLGLLGDAHAIPALVAAWRRNSGDWLRDWYVFAIGRIGGAAGCAELRALLPLADDAGRPDLVAALRETQNAAAVPALLQVLDDRRPHVRAAVRGALATLQRAQLMDGLRAALQDDDPTVRREAVLIAPFYADAEMQRQLDALQGDPDSRVAAEAGHAVAACRRKQG